MDYPGHFTEHLRIAVLRLLDAQSGHKGNSSLLRDGCDALGLTVSRDRMKVELAWLAEQGLVTNQVLDERLMIATLTERGQEAAAGRVVVPGVKPPGA